MERELGVLLLGAASVGGIHALLGPDHYLPFILLSRSRGWTLARTLRLTVACGSVHVLASLLLGAVGAAAGSALGRLAAVEQARGSLAAMLLVGFGLAYAAWGLRQARRDRPHSHWHSHTDGTVHEHAHVHRGHHAHPHRFEAAGEGRSGRWARWTLFTIFIVGPCEPLVPLLMVPAARGAWIEAGLVAAVFAAVTLGSMVGLVSAGQLGLARLAGGDSTAGRAALAPLARFGHAFAGAALAACGVAIWMGL